MTSFLLSLPTKPFNSESPLEGKNLLLEKLFSEFQNQSPWTREAKMEMAELFPGEIVPIHLKTEWDYRSWINYYIANYGSIPFSLRGTLL